MLPHQPHQREINVHIKRVWSNVSTATVGSIQPRHSHLGHLLPELSELPVLGMYLLGVLRDVLGMSPGKGLLDILLTIP